MNPPQKVVIEYLKKVFSDLHNAIVSLVVTAIVLGVGGIYIFFKNLWQILKNTVQSPTPVWVTISLGALVLVYIYVKFHKIPQATSQQGEKQKINFIEDGQLKWKVNFRQNGSFIIDDTPICIKHDIQLNHSNDGYYCFHINENGCTAKLKDEHYELKKRYIEALAENKYRKSSKISKPINIDSF